MRGLCHDGHQIGCDQDRYLAFDLGAFNPPTSLTQDRVNPVCSGVGFSFIGNAHATSCSVLCEDGGFKNLNSLVFFDGVINLSYFRKSCIN